MEANEERVSILACKYDGHVKHSPRYSDVIAILKDRQSVFAYIHVHRKPLSSTSYTYSLAIAYACSSAQVIRTSQVEGCGQLDYKRIH